MEEWSLQAVVRGSGDDEFCFGESAAPMASGSGGFGPLDLQCTGLFDDHDKAFLFSSFPDLFGDHHHQAAATVFLGKEMDSELEELYKPFYPVYNVGTQVHDCSVEAQAQYPNFPDAVAAAADHQVIKQEVVGVVEEKKIVFCASSPSSNSHATKPKKRKNQQKRVVVQVSAEGLSSDLWAWRKYGQKPIKGSPYPRSYYRCSSSKGCLARRQVEQSCTDPGTYIVTYSAEHNHPQPTRRNSLAGVNRHKFRSTPKSPTNSDGPVTAAKSNKEAPSPTTSPSFSSADEEVLQGKIKQEMGFGEDDHREMMAVAGECDDNDLELPDMAFSDDFFVGLEDLDGLNSGNMSFYNCSNKQYHPLPFCS